MRSWIIVSDNDQEIPQSQNCRQTHGTAFKFVPNVQLRVHVRTYFERSKVLVSMFNYVYMFVPTL